MVRKQKSRVTLVRARGGGGGEQSTVRVEKENSRVAADRTEARLAALELEWETCKEAKQQEDDHQAERRGREALRRMAREKWIEGRVAQAEKELRVSVELVEKLRAARLVNQHRQQTPALQVIDAVAASNPSKNVIEANYQAAYRPTDQPTFQSTHQPTYQDGRVVNNVGGDRRSEGSTYFRPILREVGNYYHCPDTVPVQSIEAQSLQPASAQSNRVKPPTPAMVIPPPPPHDSTGTSRRAIIKSRARLDNRGKPTTGEQVGYRVSKVKNPGRPPLTTNGRPPLTTNEPNSLSTILEATEAGSSSWSAAGHNSPGLESGGGGGGGGSEGGSGAKRATTSSTAAAAAALSTAGAVASTSAPRRSNVSASPGRRRNAGGPPGYDDDDDETTAPTLAEDEVMSQLVGGWSRWDELVAVRGGGRGTEDRGEERGKSAASQSQRSGNRAGSRKHLSLSSSSSSFNSPISAGVTRSKEVSQNSEQYDSLDGLVDSGVDLVSVAKIIDRIREHGKILEERKERESRGEDQAAELVFRRRVPLEEEEEVVEEEGVGLFQTVVQGRALPGGGNKNQPNNSSKSLKDNNGKKFHLNKSFIEKVLDFEASSPLSGQQSSTSSSRSQQEDRPNSLSLTDAEDSSYFAPPSIIKPKISANGPTSCQQLTAATTAAAAAADAPGNSEDRTDSKWNRNRPPRKLKKDRRVASSSDDTLLRGYIMKLLTMRHDEVDNLSVSSVQSPTLMSCTTSAIEAPTLHSSLRSPINPSTSSESSASKRVRFNLDKLETSRLLENLSLHSSSASLDDTLYRSLKQWYRDQSLAVQEERYSGQSSAVQEERYRGQSSVVQRETADDCRTAAANSTDAADTIATQYQAAAPAAAATSTPYHAATGVDVVDSTVSKAVGLTYAEIQARFEAKRRELTTQLESVAEWQRAARASLSPPGPRGGFLHQQLGSTEGKQLEVSEGQLSTSVDSHHLDGRKGKKNLASSSASGRNISQTPASNPASGRKNTEILASSSASGRKSSETPASSSASEIPGWTAGQDQDSELTAVTPFSTLESSVVTSDCVYHPVYSSSSISQTTSTPGYYEITRTSVTHKLKVMRGVEEKEEEYDSVSFFSEIGTDSESGSRISKIDISSDISASQ